MDQVEKADYINFNAVTIKGSQETEDLARNFNMMMEKLKDLLQKYMDEQNEKRKAELEALQNQINPHFLYNTLDSIIYLIDTNDNKSAHDMVAALAKFFRISISKGQTIIPVENEVEHARNYLIIQKMRYKEMFNFGIKVNPECYKYSVIKLILQPVVENSITHGIKNKTDPGFIEIKGEIKDGFLVFSIFDNGFGMLPEKIQEIYDSFKDPNSHQGVGLKNVYQRLTICYGSRADVRISSELDEGTTVQLIIPLEGAKSLNED
jgi:two-component system sensor histidine kinase YesM